MNELLSLGLRPVIRELTEVEGNGDTEEIETIAKYKLSHNLTNVSKGGAGVSSHSEESRIKMSASAKRRGMPQLQKMIENRKKTRVPISEETRARMSAAQKGRFVPMSHIQYMISKRTGPGPWKGKKMSEEAKKKMSKSKKALHFFKSLVRSAHSNHR